MTRSHIERRGGAQGGGDTPVAPVALPAPEEQSPPLRLLTLLGHELRTPLTAITAGAARIADARPISEELRTQLGRRMTVSAMRMARLIDDLSDYAVLHVSGALPLVPRPTSVRELCSDVLDEVRSAHPDRSVVEDSAGDDVVYWDRDRIAQALVNLLEAALHHGARGTPVTLRWRAAAWPPAQGTLFEVHGAGLIDPAELPHLFEPFRRDRHHGGPEGGRYQLGLGLFVAQEIVRAHGGLLTVQSSADQGTRFRVLLPWRTP